MSDGSQNTARDRDLHVLVGRDTIHAAFRQELKWIAGSIQDLQEDGYWRRGIGYIVDKEQAVVLCRKELASFHIVWYCAMLTKVTLSSMALSPSSGLNGGYYIVSPANIRPFAVDLPPQDLSTGAS